MKNLLLTLIFALPLTAQASPSSDFWQLVSKVTSSATLCSAAIEYQKTDSSYCDEYKSDSKRFRANSTRLMAEGDITFSSDAARAAIDGMSSAIGRINDSGY